MTTYKEQLEKAYEQQKKQPSSNSKQRMQGGKRKFKHNSRMQHMSKSELVTYYLGLFLVMVLIMYWASEIFLVDIYFLLRLFVAVNIGSFILFGVDKVLATTSSQITRVPERFFIWISLFGGALGIILGAQGFHHKTLKMKFMIWPVIIFLLQLLFFAIYWPR